MKDFFLIALLGFACLLDRLITHTISDALRFTPWKIEGVVCAVYPCGPFSRFQWRCRTLSSGWLSLYVSADGIFGLDRDWRWL